MQRKYEFPFTSINTTNTPKTFFSVKDILCPLILISKFMEGEA